VDFRFRTLTTLPMSRFTASPLLSAAIVLAVGACAHAQGPDPAAAPEPVHAAAAEQLGEEPRIEAARPVAVAPSILGSARYDLPVEANQWVQTELDFLVNQRHEVIGTWLQRADYYQDWVRQVFAQMGVPRDLSHLAMVESGYLPTARSHAGAVGMWQFMSGTGKGLGLRVDDIVDERMDPVRSTYAAARHLRDLNQVYNGDWALAVAAYNAGTGRISRGLRTYNVASFWDLAQAGDLAEETKHYVPRLYAVTIIGHDPARFGYAAPEGLVRRFGYDSVRVDVMTPLAQLAETGGLPLGDLLELNPHLVRQTAPADYWVWTPKGTGAAVQAAFNASDFRRSGGYGIYLVRQGDDFSRLAAAAGLSVDQVRAMNPHLDPAGLARGQRLVFPVGVATLLAGRPAERVAVAHEEGGSRSRRSSSGNSSRGNGNAGNSDADDGSASSSDDSGRASKASTPADRSSSDDTGDRSTRSRRNDDGSSDSDRPRPREDARPRTFVHTVARGETLASLADRFGVPASRIRSLNELEPPRLHRGQKLRIPRPADEQSADSDRPSRGSRASEADARPRTFEHTVKRGETLASLADRFDVPASRIRSLNEMESSRVHAGQKLRIPRPAGEQTASADRSSRSRSPSSDDSDAPARSQRGSGQGDSESDRPSRQSAPRTFVHTVVRGETLAGLADRFDVPPSRIRSLNELESNRVHPGQKLRIPRPASEQAADSERPARPSSGSDGESSGSARSRERVADADHPSTRRGTSSDSETRSHDRSSDADRTDSSRRTSSSDRERSASSERSTSSRAHTGERTASSDRASSERHGSADRSASGERSGGGSKARSADEDGPVHRAASGERPTSGARGSSSSHNSTERLASADHPRRRDGAQGESRSRSSRFTEHTVKRGETLYSIARRYEVTVGQIRSANDMAADETLSPGRRLRIPGASER
jgi:membrane-bound lytic murein transglycosylase D